MPDEDDQIALLKVAMKRANDLLATAVKSGLCGDVKDLALQVIGYADWIAYLEIPF